MILFWVNDYIVFNWKIRTNWVLMEDSKSEYASNSHLEVVTDKVKIFCDKCGGSGNLQTPENSRRTCLSCYGRGFLIW